MQALLNTFALVLAYTIISLWSAEALVLPKDFALKVWARRLEGSGRYKPVGYIKYDDVYTLRLSSEEESEWFGTHGNKIYTAATNVGVYPDGRLNVNDGKNDFDWKTLSAGGLHKGAIIITPASGLKIIECLPHGVHHRIGFFLRKKEDYKKGCESQFLYEFLFEVRSVE